MNVITRRCGYRRYFSGMGFSEASWPLARITISADLITIESLLETIEIGAAEVVDVRRELFGTRVSYERQGERQDIVLYGLGLKSILERWRESRRGEDG